MSETTTAVATPATQAVKAEKATTNKPTGKTMPTKAKTKTKPIAAAVRKTGKPSANGHAKPASDTKAKSGLRLFQTRILAHLEKHGSTVKQALAGKIGISSGLVHIGLVGADGTNPKQGKFPGLVDLKMVKVEEQIIERRGDAVAKQTFVTITTLGSKAVAKALNGGKLPKVHTGPVASK